MVGEDQFHGMEKQAYDFDRVIDRAGTGSLKWDKYAGREVLPLWVADMDFQSAPEIIEALHARANHGVFGYTIPYESVVEAVRDYLREAHGYAVEREWIVWLPGLVPALNLACRAFAEGGAVMTCTPVYPPFLSAPGNAGCALQAVPLTYRDRRWTFDFEAMEAAVTERTRLFILCNPHNPVGRCFSKEELLTLGDFCHRHRIVLCSDEIHCDLVLDAVRHHCLGTLAGPFQENTFSLFAPSKTYNLPGLACAYAVMPDARLRTRFQRTIRGIITEVNAFGYAGCEAAYRHGEPWRKALLDYLRENRRQVYTFVEEHMPGVVIRPMEATCLAWLDFRETGIEGRFRS